MNLPPTYRHDHGYEPPRPARVYDIPQIVERRPVLGRLRSILLPIMTTIPSAARRSTRTADCLSRRRPVSSRMARRCE
jgi:hypothetical protein